MMIETAAEKVRLRDAPDSDARFDAKELAIGISVEMEHTTDPEVAKKIAKHHLMENCKYYTEVLLPAEAGEVKKSSEVMELFARERGLIRPARFVHVGGISMEAIQPLALLVKSRALIQPTPVPSGSGAPAPSRKETRRKIKKQHAASTGIRSPEPNPAPGGQQVHVSCPHCGEGFAVAIGSKKIGKGGSYGPTPGVTSSKGASMKSVRDLMPNSAVLLK